MTSPLFRFHLVSFLLLYLLAKSVLVAGAGVAGLDPFRFGPLGEAWACGFELLTLAHFARRRAEEVLLGNLGLGLGDALAPFVPLHFALSGALAALVPWTL